MKLDESVIRYRLFSFLYFFLVIMAIELFAKILLADRYVLDISKVVFYLFMLFFYMTGIIDREKKIKLDINNEELSGFRLIKFLGLPKKEQKITIPFKEIDKVRSKNRKFLNFIHCEYCIYANNGDAIIINRFYYGLKESKKLFSKLVGEF